MDIKQNTFQLIINLSEKELVDLMKGKTISSKVNPVQELVIKHEN